MKHRFVKIPNGRPDGTGQSGRGRVRGIVAGLLAFCALTALPAAAVDRTGVAGEARRGGGGSQIDESSLDETASPSDRKAGPATLPDRLREYVEGSLARYDALKNDAAGFRRQGWFPSLFLCDPARDLVVEPGPGGTAVVTAHLCYAHRDLEQRLVIAPATRFELPGADKRFFAELLGALAAFAPEIGRARLRFWFAALRPDGQMSWESRGGLGLSAVAARRFPAGARTVDAIWPLLDDNTLPAAVWDGP